MKIYLATHGEKRAGFNPAHTADGLGQVIDVLGNQFQKIPKPPLLVVGSGFRFEETYLAFLQFLPSTTVKWSPFAGSADASDNNGKIAIASNNTVAEADYIGLAGNPGFDAWKFISSLPPNTLLCSGEELMSALGLESNKGRIYELETENKSCRQVI